jgi:hypothetical protein
MKQDQFYNSIHILLNLCGYDTRQIKTFIEYTIVPELVKTVVYKLFVNNLQFESFNIEQKNAYNDLLCVAMRFELTGKIDFID